MTEVVPGRSAYPDRLGCRSPLAGTARRRDNRNNPAGPRRTICRPAGLGAQIWGRCSDLRVLLRRQAEEPDEHGDPREHECENDDLERGETEEQ